MPYNKIPGYWIETIPNLHQAMNNVAPTGNPTGNVIDALNEHIQMCGRLAISEGAQSVAFDTNSRIIFRTGTGNIFTEATSVITVGIQDVDLANGPPPRGDGTYDVFGVIPSATYADIANSTTYAVPMTSGTKTLSHGDLISIKIEFTTFTASDTVRIQGLNLSGNITHSAQSILNTLSNSVAVVPLVLDFEGDNSVVGVLDFVVPPIETFGANIVFGSGVEHGMLFRMANNRKIDGVWFDMGLTDGINCEVYLYTDPLGTPSGTLLGTHDGDVFVSSAGVRPTHLYFPPVELFAGVDYVIAVKSLGTSTHMPSFGVNHINHLTHFRAFGGTNKRCTRSGGSGAFSVTENELFYWGVHVSHIDAPPGGIYQLGI